MAKVSIGKIPIPRIGANGNWFIGDRDTGVNAGGGNSDCSCDIAATDYEWRSFDGNVLKEDVSYRVYVPNDGTVFSLACYDSFVVNTKEPEWFNKYDGYLDSIYFTEDFTANGRPFTGVVEFAITSKKLNAGGFGVDVNISINGIPYTVKNLCYMSDHLSSFLCDIQFWNGEVSHQAKAALYAENAETAKYVVAENRKAGTGADFHLNGFYGVSGAFTITFVDRTELCAYSFMVYIPEGWDGSKFVVPFSVSIPYDGGDYIAEFIAIIENFTLIGFKMKDEEEYEDHTIDLRLDSCRCIRF